MRIAILGAAGFIGANLTLALIKNRDNEITLVDTSKDYFGWTKYCSGQNYRIIESTFEESTPFNALLENQDVVYHLASTSIPTTSNKKVPQELAANVVTSARLFDACVEKNIKRVIFISSGGTVYGNEAECPLSEESPTYPISSYGVQKITIEKLLYLYHHMHGLDYRIIRLANPYGPFQRPNGLLGAVTTFIFKALKNETISVYGDGSVIRDYIYIEDAIRGIINIANGEKNKIYNLGCGYGTSINQLIEIVKQTVNSSVKITYSQNRSVDVPINYLNISRYENDFGKLNAISLEIGVRKTADFLRREYGI